MLTFLDYLEEGKRGLWDNIHAKQKRIKAGSGERMRKPGSKGAPTAAALKNSQNEEVVVEGTIHVGHRNSKGDWIKISTHGNYPDAEAAMKELQKAGKKGIQHRYDNKGNIDPGAMMTARPDSGVAEDVEAQFDLIESVIDQLSLQHNLDSEYIWEKFEQFTDQELLEYSITFMEAAVDGKGYKSSTGGLTQKGRDHYNSQSGGNLKAPVTTAPSKLKAGSKAANRRKSFCARMGGMEGAMKKPNGEPTRKALALRKWNC